MSSLPFCLFAHRRVNTLSLRVWTQRVLAKRLLLLQIYLLFITISTNYFNLFLLFQILAGAKRSSHHFRHSLIPFPGSYLFLSMAKNSLHWSRGCSFFNCFLAYVNFKPCEAFTQTLSANVAAVLQSRRRNRKRREIGKKMNESQRAKNEP